MHSHFAFSSAAAAAAVEKEPRLGPLDPLLLSTHTHKVTLGTYRYLEVLCSFSKREKERKKVGVCILLGAIARTLRPILCLCEREKERKRESMAVW